MADIEERLRRLLGTLRVTTYNGSAGQLLNQCSEALTEAADEIERLRSEKLTPYMNELAKVYAENDALKAENERLRTEIREASAMLGKENERLRAALRQIEYVYNSKLARAALKGSG